MSRQFEIPHEELAAYCTGGESRNWRCSVPCCGKISARKATSMCSFALEPMRGLRFWTWRGCRTSSAGFSAARSTWLREWQSRRAETTYAGTRPPIRRDGLCDVTMPVCSTCILAARDALGFVSGLTFASRTCFRTRVRAPRRRDAGTGEPTVRDRRPGRDEAGVSGGLLAYQRPVAMLVRMDLTSLTKFGD